jgi:hypothetical protein
MKIRLPKLNFFNYINVPRPMMVWFVGMTALTAGLEIAWINGIIQGIYASDFTKITVLIAIVLGWQSIMCGIEMWNQTQWNGSHFDAEETVERGWLWSDIVLSLGMIGTVIGFMMMLAGFIDIDFSDFESVQVLITKLSGGMATSLSTTLVLKLQFFGLERVVEGRKRENKVL